jgi:hypothetical protein
LPFADLETMALADYLTREAARPGLWYYIDIPQTAGRAIPAALSQGMRPYRNLFTQDPDPSRSHEAKMGDVLDGFLGGLTAAPCRAASGHTPWHMLDALRAALPDLRIFTMLRQPEERVIADYLYQCSAAHPPHESFQAQFPRLEDYIDHPSSQETMTTYLYGKGPRPTPEALIDHLGRGFAFVGLADRAEFSLAQVFGAMGRTAPAFDPPPAADVSQDLRALIRRANPLDQVAYDYVLTMLRRHEP